MSPAAYRMFVAGGAVVLWAGLAVMGKTPIDPLIEVLKMVVNSVAVYHLTLRDPKGK